MKIGLLSDAHGNPDALELCLQTLERLGVDALYFLGDAVGYLPGEGEVLDRLDRSGAICQQGNHEAMLLSSEPPEPERDEVYRLAAARQRLDAGRIRDLASWPTARELSIHDHTILLVHGAPGDPLNGYVYPDSDLSRVADPRWAAVFCGHTHRPLVAVAGETLVVNVGSVGLPRDVGALASVVIYDGETRRCRICRIRFDAEAVLARWGDCVHPSVAAVLRRRAEDFVGELV
jgi:predicted phosphodiesterase